MELNVMMEMKLQISTLPKSRITLGFLGSDWSNQNLINPGISLCRRIINDCRAYWKCHCSYSNIQELEKE